MADIPNVGKDTEGWALVIPCGRDVNGFTTRKVYYLKPDRTTTGNIDHAEITVVDDPDGNTNYAMQFTVPNGLLDQEGEYRFWPYGTDGTEINEGRPPSRLQVTDRT